MVKLFICFCQGEVINLRANKLNTRFCVPFDVPVEKEFSFNRKARRKTPKTKMESNRDEAERCITIAAQALRDSKMEKAEKFLKKAEKLYPSQKAKGECTVVVWVQLCMT